MNIPKIKNVSHKSCRENQETHSLFNNFFLKIVPFTRMWKNMVQPDTPQMTIKYGAYVFRAR